MTKIQIYFFNDIEKYQDRANILDFPDLSSS